MKRILIIDDDIDMCQLLSHYLQRKGFETDSANTGNKGIAKFTENKFDVVLCDFRLGDMDGRKVLQKIKSINPGVVVIIITGYSDVKMAVEVMRYGAFDYITKPLIPEEVINFINRGLDESTISVETRTVDSTDAANPGNKNSISSTKEFLVGISPRTV